MQNDTPLTAKVIITSLIPLLTLMIEMMEALGFQAAAVRKLERDIIVRPFGTDPVLAEIVILVELLNKI